MNKEKSITSYQGILDAYLLRGHGLNDDMSFGGSLVELFLKKESLVEIAQNYVTNNKPQGFAQNEEIKYAMMARILGNREMIQKDLSSGVSIKH